MIQAQVFRLYISVLLRLPLLSYVRKSKTIIQIQGVLHDLDHMFGGNMHKSRVGR